MLYIIPTPIGNLKDITLRSLEVLQSVDGIICEDSRRTSLLLNHYTIKKPLLVINDYNESNQALQILQKLISGQNLALVSDAGTPLISDPGYKLVQLCIENNIEVDSLPGPSSVPLSLTLSGLPPDKWMFVGYLPQKPGHRKEMIQKLDRLKDLIPMTYIVFVAPHKLVQTLEDIHAGLGDIEIVLEKELTKIHQTIQRGKISEIETSFTKTQPKGEYILLFHLNS